MRVRVTGVLVAFAVIVGMNACGGDDSDSVETPALARSAEEVAVISADFTDSVRDHFESWNSHDLDGVRSHWNPNTVFDDTLNLQQLTGDELANMPEGVFKANAAYRTEVTEVLVSEDVALAIMDAWGVAIGRDTYTEDDPFQGIDRIQFAADGTFDQWTAFVSLEAYERARASSARLDAARELLDSYEAAWESGDGTTVAAIYAADARRVDSLFGANPSGTEEIAMHAAEYFDAYTAPALTPVAQFSDNRSTISDPEQVGSVFRVDDASGCSVTMAVLLSARDGLIIHEEVFWNADSLIGCNWAT